MRSAVALLSLIAACGGTVDGANGSGRSGINGEATDAGSDGASVVGVSYPPGTCNPATPVHEDFEHALDPSWTITNPTGLKVDANQAITGTHSVNFTFDGSQYAPYFAVNVASVCVLKLTFTIRVDAKFLSSSAGTIMRVKAGPVSIHLAIASDGSFSLPQELRTAEAASMSFPGMLGSLAVNTSTLFVFTFDVKKNKLTMQFGSTGSPLPQPTPIDIRPGATDITAIELGGPPGFSRTSRGTLWLDDLSVE